MKHVFVFPQEGVDRKKLGLCTRNLKQCTELIGAARAAYQHELRAVPVKEKQELYKKLVELNGHFAGFSDEQLENLCDYAVEGFHEKIAGILDNTDLNIFKLRSGEKAGSKIVVMDCSTPQQRHPIFYALDLGYLDALDIRHLEAEH